MLRFDEIFIKGMPRNIENRSIPDQYSVWREWQSFLDETKRFLEKTKNRKPIVDFKVREEIRKEFE